jgi:hypothetical protein
MKYFGFIKEHDNYEYSINIQDLIKEKNTENPHRKEVIEYLEKGKLCVAWMGCVEDAMNPRFNDEDYEDNDFMGYAAVDTDGEWYWPEYVVNYLKKYPTINIDENFVNYVIKNKNNEIQLSEEEVSSLEKKYLEKA